MPRLGPPPSGKLIRKSLMSGGCKLDRGNTHGRCSTRWMRPICRQAQTCAWERWVEESSLLNAGWATHQPPPCSVPLQSHSWLTGPQCKCHTRPWQTGHPTRMHTRPLHPSTHLTSWRGSLVGAEAQLWPRLHPEAEGRGPLEGLVALALALPAASRGHAALQSGAGQQGRTDHPQLRPPG